MDDAGGARELEHAPICATSVGERRRRSSVPPLAQQLAERLAAQALHREERQRIARRRRLEHAHDVRRVERARDADLAQEPLDVLRIGEQLAAQQLDRGVVAATSRGVAS